MPPDRSSLAERLRRSRARVVGRVATPEPVAEAPLPEAIADQASAGTPEGPHGSDKTARLARARELIRRTERGWKELRIGSAGDGQPPLRKVQPGAAPEVDDGETDPTPEARPADEPFSREDHDFPLASRYGGADLVRLLEVSEEAAARLQIRPEEPGVDLSRALFLDTETSGLAGGTGTFAFLIGVGFVEEDRFRVTQFLMRSPLGEAAMLEELAVLAAGRRDLVTYNGGSFDLPLLETRFALNGVPSPFRDARHLDLLHPARRLFKPRHENARLSTLERELLEVERDDDIPGDRIPQVFFDFLRYGHHPAMESVLAHNRYDIVTLAALALRALERLDEDWHSDDPADLHGAGHHFWRRGNRRWPSRCSSGRCPPASPAGTATAACSTSGSGASSSATGPARSNSGAGSASWIPGSGWTCSSGSRSTRSTSGRTRPGRSPTSRTPSNGFPGSRWAGKRAAATGRNSNGAPPGCRKPGLTKAPAVLRVN